MKNITIIILTVLIISVQFLPAQAPDTLWIKTFGGSNIDIGHSVQQTMDGGFIITGYTRSYGAMSGRNIWLVKTDASGIEEWNNTFGGDDDEEGYSVQQTADGGYILAGYTKSFGAGLNDVILIKTDSSGNSQWIRIFGGAQDDEGYCLDQTDDGGYIIAGVTSSSGAGSRDVWLIKTDDFGNEEWNRTLGGFSSDGAWSVRETSDGGFILTGWTFSYGPGYLGNAWLVKTDSSGMEEWNQAFGGTDADRGYSVEETTDGGYILTGYTGSSGAGLYDLLLIKTDSSGSSVWNKTFGGTGRDYGNSVRQTSDGGYILTGYTLSSGAGGEDLWVIKTDASGNEQWSRTFGGSASDVGFDVQQTSDRGYIITGHTLSFGAGLHDVFLIRLAPQPMPLFVVNRDSILFGNVVVGDTLLDSVMVQNKGNADLVIDSTTSTNNFFSISPASATIVPDARAKFFIRFSTDEPGNQNGVLLFYHNGLTSPDSVFVQSDVINSLVVETDKIPQKFALYQNYPNPFNPTTIIAFDLPAASKVTLKIYNCLGEEIKTLLSGILLSGSYECEWDASNLPSGVYFYRLQAGKPAQFAGQDFFDSRKMILVR